MDNNDLVQELIRKSFYRLTLEECEQIVKSLSVEDFERETIKVYDTYYDGKESYKPLSFSNSTKYDIKKAFENCIEEKTEYGEDVVCITNTNLLHGDLLSKEPIVVERCTKVFNGRYHKYSNYNIFISVPDIESSILKEFNRNKFSFLLGSIFIDSDLKEKIISDFLGVSIDLNIITTQIEKKDVKNILENENVVREYTCDNKEDGVVLLVKNFFTSDYALLVYTNPEKIFNEIICEKLNTSMFVQKKYSLKENPLTLFSDRAVFSEVQDFLIKYYHSFLDGKSDNLEIIAFKSDKDLEKAFKDIKNNYISNIECNCNSEDGGFCSETHFDKLFEKTIWDLKLTVVNITVDSSTSEVGEYYSSDDTTILISCPRLF